MSRADVPTTAARPDWVELTLERAEAAPPEFYTRHHRPLPTGREGAVLMCLVPCPGDPGRGAVILTERAGDLRSHAGQVAFPGGRIDPGDQGPVGAALREADEEIGLAPAAVDVLTAFPTLGIPASQSSVTPVLAWCARPQVHARSVAEVAAVVTAPLAELADPARRFTVTHPNGYRGVGFAWEDLFVWGFTAGLLDRLLVLTGDALDWDRGVTRDLPDRVSGGRAPALARHDES